MANDHLMYKKQKKQKEKHTHTQTNKSKKPYDNVDGNTVDSS